MLSFEGTRTGSGFCSHNNQEKVGEPEEGVGTGKSGGGGGVRAGAGCCCANKNEWGPRAHPSFEGVSEYPECAPRAWRWCGVKLSREANF